MSTIEERVRDALEDLRDLLAEGREISGAIAEAAEAYELKADVLQVRALKAFGELTTVRGRVDAAKSEGARKFRLRSAIERYRTACLQDDVPGGAEWLRDEVGDDLSEDERQAALRECMDIWMYTQLSKILELSAKTNA
jgi:hypothetical protein